MNKTDIPVILFAYNRAKQLKGTLAQLKKNKIPILYIFIDGPRNEQDASKVNDVIKLARSISWTKTKVIRRKSNLGLSASIQKGLDAVFFEHESAIIIEDDIIVADGFYDFMCRALKAYEDKRDIAGVTGLRYPFKSRALRKGELMCSWPLVSHLGVGVRGGECGERLIFIKARSLIRCIGIAPTSLEEVRMPNMLIMSMRQEDSRAAGM